MHYSHWQITECCQLPLSSLPHHYDCPCTALTKPLESYSTFQLRSKTMSSRDQVTEFRQQQSTVLLCLHGYFCIEFCSVLLPPQQQQLIRICHNDHENIKQNQLPQRTESKAATYRWGLRNIFYYIANTICPSMLCQLRDR